MRRSPSRRGRVVRLPRSAHRRALHPRVTTSTNDELRAWAEGLNHRVAAVELVGTARASNRIAMAPRTNKQSHDDGTLSAAEITWLTRRAQGGFGTVITGGYAVSPEGRVWDGQAGVYSQDHITPLSRLAVTLARTSTPGIVQLIHGGSRFSPRIAGQDGISASAGTHWRAATEADLDDLVEAHRAAALRVQAAGLHGIEIHSAHGYLPAQFISPVENTRTDRWGGDLVGRARFLRTVVQTVRAAVDPGFVVGVRLSPEDARRGLPLSETTTIAGWLVQDGIDYLHLSLRDAQAPSEADPAVHPIDAVRSVLPDQVALMVAGKIWTPDEAQQALDRKADLVALGLAAIHHPQWPHYMSTPGWTPTPPPTPADQLAATGVSARFLDYLRENWPHTVSDS